MKHQSPSRSDEEQRLDAWYEETEEMARQIPPEDHDRLEAALAEADREAKEYVRRQMERFDEEEGCVP